VKSHNAQEFPDNLIPVKNPDFYLFYIPADIFGEW